MPQLIKYSSGIVLWVNVKYILIRMHFILKSEHRLVQITTLDQSYTTIETNGLVTHDPLKPSIEDFQYM